jgi:hypothetical protein
LSALVESEGWMALTTLALVRRLIDEPAEDLYKDEELADRLAATSPANDVNTVVRDVWQEKMAAAAGLVDTSEGGSQRRMDQAYQHAKQMYEMYAGLVADVGRPSVIRRLTRTA